MKVTVFVSGWMIAMAINPAEMHEKAAFGVGIAIVLMIADFLQWAISQNTPQTGAK